MVLNTKGLMPYGKRKEYLEYLEYLKYLKYLKLRFPPFIQIGN